ncbi:hypothetical protein ACHAW5_007241 [Stephanodiscus triporus]|uniref:Impact N-terminal domain-containing protein n=1 Tax=Stephanodiscus triporus TaxID=2934178 RepID=A0ABD3NSZ2_9STRA
MEPMLEVRLSSSYPIGTNPPVLILHNIMMDPASMRGLLSDMMDASGPSKLMLVTVCVVTHIEHVQWVLANLIYGDKRMSGESHNMFAYRFFANDIVNGRIMLDNDDNGERGAGNKLSSLLEACRTKNVLVVVSRWFGGVHLGPVRFKWIASMARDGLEWGGFIGR